MRWEEPPPPILGWEDPPPKRHDTTRLATRNPLPDTPDERESWARPRRDWDSVAAELRRRPGVWARVADDVPVNGGVLDRRAFRDSPDDWETAFRTGLGYDSQRGYRGTLFMRYVGGEVIS